MNLATVRRDGDGVFTQAFIPVTEEIDMKLKCTVCVERYGDAVKTDQLYMVSTIAGDKLVCVKCKERLKGGDRHESANNQPE